MGTIKRIAKNTFFLFLSNLFQKLISLFIVIFVAKKLGIGDFGVYSFVFSFVVLFTVFSDFGLTTLAFREISKDKSKAKSLLGEALVMKIFLAVIVFLVVFAGIFALHVLQPASYPWIIIILVLMATASMVLDSLAGLFRMAFFSFERMELDFLANVVYKGFLFAASFAILLLGFGLWELVIVTVLASLANLLASILLCSKKIVFPEIKINLANYRRLFFAALPFCLIGVFASVYGNTDIVLLSFLKGNIEVAYYSAAVRLVNALAFIPTAFLTSVFPVMAVLFSQKNASLGLVVERSIKYLLIVILPIAFGTSLLAPQIIAAIYPTTAANNFAPAAAALQILIWFSVLSFVNLVFLNALSSTAFEKRTSLLLGITVAINIASNLLLIPIFGFVGAAFSMVVSEAFFFVFGLSATRKRLHEIRFIGILSKPLLASLLMSLAIWLLIGIGLLPLIVLSGIVYLAFLFLLKTFDANDYLIASKLLKGKD